MVLAEAQPMGVILSLLLRGYDWELVPGQDLSFVPLPFPHPRSGLEVRFSRRREV
ncbi:hypothetical protein [Archangium sp.]|uniref:hypothetical protein n=1 Tax=Archangium sp. TaxID=1872627 RepID=UPI003899E988